MALEAGAEGAARILKEFSAAASPNTLLARLHNAAMAGPCRTIRYLGIDDWAWRKGPRYGQLLVDLERHQVAATSLISLVDEHRQWFKACVGFDLRETD